METAALIQTEGVDVVVGRHEPQLSSALRRDRRRDGFDECAPDTDEALVTGYRDCCQLGPVFVKSVGGDAEDVMSEPCAKAG
jgi:hypothetical protein